MAATADTSNPYIPLAGLSTDGHSNSESATATCYCGAVQLAFPTSGPGLRSTFVCHCTDCRKITASMFTSAFSVLDSHLTHVRGQENLTCFSQSQTIAAGNTMSNYFCKTCGSLMYRIQKPGAYIMRIGTVDDFSLHETLLKPGKEIWVQDRCRWVSAVPGAVQHQQGGPARKLPVVVISE